MDSQANAEVVARSEYGALAFPDFRPSWQHLAARVIRYGGALTAGEWLARRNVLDSRAGLPFVKGFVAPRILILCYHRIGAGGVPFYSELSPSLFERQMGFLRRHYRVLPLEEAVIELESPKGGSPAVVVTFDDGYRDLYSQALPALGKYKIPATIYLTAGAIETGEVAWYDRIFLAMKHVPGPTFECEVGEKEARVFEIRDAFGRFQAAVNIITALRKVTNETRKMLCADLERRVELPRAELSSRMLTWEQVRIMQGAGVEFGGHTMTHPAVSRLNTKALDEELVESKGLLEERLGKEVRHFAYPFGKSADCGLEASAILERAGYQSAVTTIGGVNTFGSKRYELARVSLGEERSLEMFAVQLNLHFLRAESGAGLAAESNRRAVKDGSHRQQRVV